MSGLSVLAFVVCFPSNLFRISWCSRDDPFLKDVVEQSLLKNVSTVKTYLNAPPLWRQMFGFHGDNLTSVFRGLYYPRGRTNIWNGCFRARGSSYIFAAPSTAEMFLCLLNSFYWTRFQEEQWSVAVRATEGRCITLLYTFSSSSERLSVCDRLACLVPVKPWCHLSAICCCHPTQTHNTHTIVFFFFFTFF